MATDLEKLFYTPRRCQQDIALALEFLFARAGGAPQRAFDAYAIPHDIRRAAKGELRRVLTGLTGTRQPV